VGVAIGTPSMLLVLNIATTMMKKVKILPKGLEGTELIFENAKVRYPKSAVPITFSCVSHLPQCRYESQRCFIKLDHPLERVW
jgi:hypothetical protein